MFASLRHSFPFLRTSDAGYYLPAVASRCLPCSGGRPWLGLVIVLIVALVAAVTLYRMRDSLNRIYTQHEKRFGEYNTRATAMVILMQIILVSAKRWIATIGLIPHHQPLSSLSPPLSLRLLPQILKNNHTSVGGEEMTNPYVGFLNFFAFLSLDVITILPLECVWRGHL